jgi:hypothetical protein
MCFVLNCQRVVCIIISSINDTGVYVQIPAGDLNKSRNCSLANLRLLLLLLLFHNSSSIFCSLLVPINILKDINAIFNESRTFSRLQNRHCPLLRARVRLRFLSLTRGSVLPNFNKMTELEFLIMGFQKIEDTFSIACTGLTCWIWEQAT